MLCDGEISWPDDEWRAPPLLTLGLVWQVADILCGLIVWVVVVNGIPVCVCYICLLNMLKAFWRNGLSAADCGLE